MRQDAAVAGATSKDPDGEGVGLVAAEVMCRERCTIRFFCADIILIIVPVKLSGYAIAVSPLSGVLNISEILINVALGKKNPFNPPPITEGQGESNAAKHRLRPTPGM